MSKETKRKALDRLVSDLSARQGENLASIILYGSSATGDQSEAHSDYNVLVVLKQATADDLSRLQDAVRAWTNTGQLPPVIFTTSELDRAADVFPIEFLQMQKARKVLHGADPLDSVTISLQNLRHQTEYELRTKFLQLRRLYVSERASAAKLSQLMVDSFGSFAALFRAVLLLRGQQPPVRNSDAVRATVSLLDLGPAPFEWILKRKADPTGALANEEVNLVFAAYLAEIERVIAAVDNLENV